MEGFFHLSDLVSQKPEIDIPKCGRCKLKNFCKSPMIPTKEGNRPILIIGPPPSKTEDMNGKWMSGDSGEMLKETLADLGSPAYSYIGSLICKPKNLTKPIRAIGEHIKDCRANIFNQVKQQKPIVVILLGDLAVKSFIGGIWKKDLGSNNMEKWYGWQIPLYKYKCYVIPTYSPRDILEDDKNQIKRNLFVSHLKSAVRLARQNDYSPIVEKHKKLTLLKKRIELIYEPKEVKRFIEKMSEAKITAFDYETTCKKPEYKGAQIVSCSISDGKETAAFPFVYVKTIQSIKRQFRDYLHSTHTGKIGSNIKFEDRWSNHFFQERGIVRGWKFDTMLGAHFYDCRRGITGLKFQAFVQLGVLTYDDAVSQFLSADESKGNKINRIMDDVSMEKLLTYNAEDSLYEWHLAKELTKLTGLYDSVFKGD